MEAEKDMSLLLGEITSHLNTGKTSEAESIVHQIWGDEPSDARAIYLLAEIRFLEGDYNSALDENRKLSAVTDNQVISLQRAKILLNLGELDKASCIYTEILAQDPHNSEADKGLHTVQQIGKSRVGKRTVTLSNNPDSLLESSTSSSSTTIYTARDEQLVIERLLTRLQPPVKYLIDIGAADAINFSNSYKLLQEGWRGLAIEPKTESLADICNAYRMLPERVDVLSIYANPQNVCQLFDSLGVPSEPGFITLDIDSFEFEMVAAILQQFRPYLLCVEINERIPPPVRFSILYEPGRVYGDITMLGGCSIQLMADLLAKLDYAIVYLEYNNLFAIPKRLLHLVADEFKELSAAEAYTEGYLEKPDKFTVYPWNYRYKEWLEMPPRDFIAEFGKLLAPYSFKYVLRDTDN